MTWIDKWTQDQGFYEEKVLRFQVLDSKLQFEPKRILDIGCGLAVEAEQFQKKYGSELYLVEGNPEDGGNRQVDWGSTESMKFYTPVEQLKVNWDKRGLKYTFVNAANVNIPSDIKFDLIHSSKSCGFHYPLGAYKEVLLNNTTPDCRVVMDMRLKRQQEMNFESVELLFWDKKCLTLQIRPLP